MDDTTPAIKACGLVKHYGETRAVDGVGLDIPRRIVFGLLGPNGAGTTTIIRMLATLVTPWLLACARARTKCTAACRLRARGSCGAPGEPVGNTVTVMLPSCIGLVAVFGPLTMRRFRTAT